ncbi:MAG: SCO family protein [Planctomycetes bacterium]|nr:SCO family protein [Planctomycetota bacterium]
MNKPIVFLLAALALAGVLLWRTLRDPNASDAAAGSSAAELPKYMDVPDFAFTDQHGRPIGPQELRGTVWVANFVFTQCTSICPTMSGKMVRLQRTLAEPELRFVSFSVDPKNDTPEVLASYAERWSPGETRWVLLATDDAGLERTARAIGVAVEASDDAENPILHSNRFFLIDPRGVVRGVYSSDDDDAMTALQADADALLEHEFPGPRRARAALDGAGLFQAYGCAACHADAKLAPPLAGLFGRSVALDGGATRVADAAYVEESIVDPAAQLVLGYRPTMPAYGAALGAEELARLVAHVRSLEAPAGAPAPETPIEAKDPVCRMKVTAVSDTPACEYEGRRFWFCCEDCLVEFQADPAKFANR